MSPQFECPISRSLIANKKDTVTGYLKSKNIMICCLQETEIPMNFPEDFLDCGDFNIELELNDTKKRTGIYIRRDVKYKRRKDLEKKNYHVVIIDVIGTTNMRILNIYVTSFSSISHYSNMRLISKIELERDLQSIAL